MYYLLDLKKNSFRTGNSLVQIANGFYSLKIDYNKRTAFSPTYHYGYSYPGAILENDFAKEEFLKEVAKDFISFLCKNCDFKLCKVYSPII